MFASTWLQRFNAWKPRHGQPLMLRSLLLRSAWLPAAITAILLVCSLALLVGASWRSLERLDPIHAHQLHLYRLQDLGLRLQEALVESLDTSVDSGDVDFGALRRDLDRLLGGDDSLVQDTPSRLRRARILLDDLKRNPRTALIAALGELRSALVAEYRAHDTLLRDVQNNALLELRVSSALTVVIPLLGLMLLFLLRRRILLPLNNLRDLMAHLARQEYRSAATENVTPVLLPVFENYNHMVERLQELERHHRERQESLEAAVHRATATLLQQQRELARSERLAAVGELAAGVAHELRNPLAGVQMALSGLHRDLTDAGHRDRIELILGEIKRLSRLLNDLLGQARTPPEPPVAVDLGRTLEELLELVRLQVPARVRLDAEVTPGLCCRLPEAGLRQAILNLLLNAAQAIGEREGHIHVTAAREAGQLRLSVADDGPGLPAELLQDGVRAFVSWREGGTGLGLAMVQRFAREQDGRLELGAREPGGACVSLLLPCGTSADE